MIIFVGMLWYLKWIKKLLFQFDRSFETSRTRDIILSHPCHVGSIKRRVFTRKRNNFQIICQKIVSFVVFFFCLCHRQNSVIRILYFRPYFCASSSDDDGNRKQKNNNRKQLYDGPTLYTHKPAQCYRPVRVYLEFNWPLATIYTYAWECVAVILLLVVATNIWREIDKSHDRRQ